MSILPSGGPPEDAVPVLCAGPVLASIFSGPASYFAAPARTAPLIFPTAGPCIYLTAFPMPDDETIALRVTVIAGKRYADDYTVIWRDLPIGRIMKRSVVPAQADQWWYGFTFYGPPSLGSYSGTGTDLEDCIAKFKTAWTRIRADLTDDDIALAYKMRR